MGGRAVCAAGLVGLAVALACSPGVFACIESSDCRSGEIVGTCEADGWCSFPDDACPSGARYGDHAGAGLAGECVPSGSASTTGDDETNTSATTTTATTTSTTATTTVATTATSNDPTGDPTTSVDGTDTDVAQCGNGVPDPGEPCDDGNEIVGDGCNPGCILGGEVVWSIVVGGNGGGFDGAFTLEQFTNGDLAAGVAVGTDEGAQPGVWRIDPDGMVLWEWSFGLEMPWPGAYTWGLALDQSGEDTIGVSATGSGPDGAQLVVGLVDGSGATQWTSLTDGTSFGVAMDPSGALWSGGYDLLGAGTVLQYSPDGGLAGTNVGEPYGPDTGFPFEVRADGDRLLVAGRYDTNGGTFAYYRAIGEMAQLDTSLGDYNEGLGIAYDAVNDREWVVGYTNTEGGHGWIAAYSHGETILAPTIVTQDAEANLHGVAVAPNGVAVAVGWESPDRDHDAAVVVVDVDGTVVWSRTYPAPGDAALRDVVVSDDGAIFVAGEGVADDGTLDGWIARLDP